MNSKTDTSKRVLIIEDNPLARWTGRVCLEKMGYQVSEAASCLEAEELWKAHDLDLILMDYRLPDGLGTDLVKKMRASGYENAVICLTAETENISAVKRRKLGIAAVLNKPIDVSLLEAEIIKAAGNRDTAPGSGVSKRGCGGKPEEKAFGETGTHIGRFLLISCPAELTVEFIKNLCESHPVHEWIALDMRHIDNLDGSLVSAFASAADERLAAGGRLCLAGVSGELLAGLSGSGADRMMDIVGDIRVLESLGRRLTSVSERKSVLDSVIERN